jgi:hypothetical protein
MAFGTVRVGGWVNGLGERAGGGGGWGRTVQMVRMLRSKMMSCRAAAPLSGCDLL